MNTSPFRHQTLSPLGTNQATTLGSQSQSWSIGLPTRSSKNRSLRKIDLLMLTTQLSIMSKSGLDLADAIQQLASRAARADIRQALQKLHNDLQDGNSFSIALRKQTDQFGGAFVAAIAAGEASGKLVEVLDRQKELLRSEVRIRSAIMGSLAYPGFLTAVSLAVVSILVLFVLPQFDTVFRNMGVPAPTFTQLLINVATFVRQHWIVELVLLVVALIGAYQGLQTKAVRSTIDRIALSMPLLRKGMRYLMAGRMFRMMGTMIQSGVPVLETIRLCRFTVRNHQFQSLTEDMEDAILAGKQLSPSLAEADFLPDGTTEMIATSERTGQLGPVLSLIGEFFEEEGERTLKDHVKMVEPIIIIVAGFFVAIIVASIMLPLFDLSSSPR